MVSSPFRSAPVLADAVYATVPPPVPVAPAVIVSHEDWLVAVHAQLLVVVTVMDGPAPPPAATEVLPGATEKLHGAAAAGCETLIVRPATVSPPVRATPVFDAAVNATVPLPVPDAPDVIVSHPAPLTAVHSQSARVLTEIGAPAPPATAIDWLNGATE